MADALRSSPDGMLEVFESLLTCNVDELAWLAISDTTYDMDTVRLIAKGLAALAQTLHDASIKMDAQS